MNFFDDECNESGATKRKVYDEREDDNPARPVKGRREPQSRGWCFTINNYSHEDQIQIADIRCVYLTYGCETGKCGTPHLQGYVNFAAPKVFSTVQKQFPFGSHLEMQKGTFEQAIAYCHKEDDKPFEIGKKPLSAAAKGAKNAARYELAYDLAKAGKLNEIDPQLLVCHYSSFKSIKKDYMVTPADAESTTGFWIYGPAGVGKSRWAREQYPGAYTKMVNKWWDGYQNQPYVICDDWDPKHFMLGHQLKIWSDRYSYIAENKGGAFSIRPEVFVVTSQYSIEQCFPDEPETIAAIKRRFKVVHMPETPFTSCIS